MDDVREAVVKLKNGKRPVIDGIMSEMLWCGGKCVVEWSSVC